MNETALKETAYSAGDALWPSLHSPQWLWLLPLVLVAFGLLLLTARRGREQALATFAAQRLLTTLLASVSRTRRALKSVLVLIGAALIVLAIARPQYGFRWSESRSRGIDVVFVLDTSRSMLATDIKPDRLQRAKLAMLDFVEQLDGDRIGLVAFAGDAFVQCPLTLDYNVFEQSLDAINTDTIPVGGTDFARAITVAEDAFAKDNNHKILIMLTDGEDLEGQGLKRAKEAAKNGVTIFTVGVGTAEGSLIPMTDRFGRRDFLRDERGQQVMTRLEAETLDDIAEVTGGFYVPLGSAGQGLETVYRDGLQAFEKQELSSQMKREGIDRFQWPLGLAILLLAWEPLISNRKASARRAFKLFTRKRNNAAGSNTASNATAGSSAAGNGTAGSSTANARSNSISPALAALLVPALLIVAAAIPTDAQAAARSAESLFNKGDFAAATEAFTQLLDAEPANTRARYNLGNAQLAQKHYEAAAKTYAQVLADADIALQADTFYNLGLAHYGRGTQAFEGSNPVETQTQSAHAAQISQQILNEGGRLQALAASQQHNAATDSPEQPARSSHPQHEVPQEAIRQAIQLAEQAKQASETALESGEALIEKAQAASGFWRRAAADFNSAAELSAGNAPDARHNAEQTQKSIDALSARISQTQRANQTHEKDVLSLEKLIEELKKLLKEQPQDQQDNQEQQDNQQNQDQQNQDQQNQQNDQNQSGQQDQQSGQQDQQNDQQSGEQSQQDQQQGGQDQQQSQQDQQDQQQSGEQNQDSQGDKNQQDNQQQSQGNENQNQPEQSPDSGESGQQEPQDGQPKPDEQQQGDAQPDRPEGQQQQQGEQPQQQQGGDRQQSANPEEQGGREHGDEQAVDLTEEQREQMAAGEQALQDQSAAAQPEAAAQRTGAMSQQEAAGLLESLNRSGKLLPLSGRGQQQQYTRPSRDW